ncbi:hypothetical protein TOPH_03065 [Tolypocladium ophioglossoides CBS 100239]|uniref:SPT2 chromatin protein n=1 Tax=Tolypocladium ophioglossoides (strain CBS 100239) TaxID=1163406 RepID=A0A0L0NEB0_TOLOC|nr:hypothetical protein TOPH_03065 [Tolypocladium ophioglossoides CBS 100239]
MPIGDLLAQITGEKSAASATATTILPRANSLPVKRKPNDDLRRDVSKTPRKVTPPQRPTPAARPTSEKLPVSQRPAVGNAVKPSASSSASATPKVSKPSAIGRPSPSPAAASIAPRAPPKKGSFAEILARGQRAQAVMGQVGKIQHKKVEKGASKGKEEAKPTAQVRGKSTTGYAGTVKSAPRNGANWSGPVKKEARDGAAPRSKLGTAKSRAEEDTAVKKVRKAALATTGYTGTARPKPADPAGKKDAPRGGALLNAPKPRHSSSKRSRYENDYDEELDDVIEYDDEEEEGPRYGYASDASSDMEAGLDELDVEERRAEVLARKEDIEEERLEKTLKAAKEDRKRKALAALRAGKRN